MSKAATPLPSLKKKIPRTEILIREIYDLKIKRQNKSGALQIYAKVAAPAVKPTAKSTKIQAPNSNPHHNGNYRNPQICYHQPENPTGTLTTTRYLTKNRRSDEKMGQRFPSIYLTEARGRPDEGEGEGRGGVVNEMDGLMP